MSSKVVKLSDTELLEYDILKYIPSRWKQECDFKGIDEDSKWSEAQVFYLSMTNTSRTLTIDIQNPNGT